MESCSGTGLRFDPYLAAVAFDDALDNRQPDTAAFVATQFMQALEHLENSPGVHNVEPDAVVGYGKLPITTSVQHPYADLWRLLAPKLDRI